MRLFGAVADDLERAVVVLDVVSPKRIYLSVSPSWSVTVTVIVQTFRRAGKVPERIVGNAALDES
jgi:hypothetical protein